MVSSAFNVHLINTLKYTLSSQLPPAGPIFYAMHIVMLCERIVGKGIVQEYKA